MCKGRALIAVDHDGVEGACGGREVLPVSLLTRLRSDRGQSCKWITTDTNRRTANAELVLGVGDSTRRGRH